MGPAAPGPDDLQAVQLLAAPFLDGYADEWPRNSPFRRVFSDGPHQLALLAGVHERMAYLLIEVRDAHPVFDAPGADVLDRRPGSEIASGSASRMARATRTST